MSIDSYGPDTRGAPHYESGRPWGICDRCEDKHRRDQLRLEWTSLWVCQTCWDPRPPEMTPPRVWPEGVAIAYPKPEPPNIFVCVNDPYSGTPLATESLWALMTEGGSLLTTEGLRPNG